MNCATSSPRCAHNLLGISVHYLSERNDRAMRITTGKRFCRKCGAAIPPNSPQQSCGACLLESGLGPVEAVAGVDDPGRPIPTLMDFGDYELIEQIGRGGQGVVFRARQKSLNRIVALKVIGLGHWATEAHLKRFRLEAEAAARLEHPGIVPIHEVGERDGSCYFSMKFVEGGQLDEVVRRAPMSIRQAAELIAKVARTVHYAHEHGILHRDIKPGNILLDAKGEPHLTDSGLARLVESESTVTRTMEVLGTPSYMAPEQAVGNNAGISSITDVYGLGAILYQLLTGQPPFAGGTTYETIKLLLDTEPRQPRLLNPKIDRDLSTILSQMSGERSKAPLLFRSRARRGFGTLAKTRADSGQAHWNFHARKKMGPTQSKYRGNGGLVVRAGSAIGPDDLEKRIRPATHNNWNRCSAI
jgi:serine/threonine protein kinase